MPSAPVDPATVQRSNPGKVFFPEPGFTKGDLVGYYERIGPRMLPHLRGRALVMERFPDGIDAEGWYQKEAARHFPAWVRRAALAKRDGTVSHVVVDDVATLVYLADQAMVTPHVWLSLVDRPDHPDELVLDLDPGADLGAVPRAAQTLHDLLDELGMPCFAKSSGSKGIHIHVPLDGSADFVQAKAVARALAEVAVHRRPDELTTALRKNQRDGKLLVDVHRNAYAQHAVAPYGVRPLPPAPVAVPLDWDEATASDFDARRITIANVFRRLGHKVDPWTGFGEERCRLASVVGRLDRLVTNLS